MLPGVAGFVMGGCAPGGVLVVELPKRRPLQPTAMTGSALGSVDSFTAFDGRGIIGVGEVRDGSRQNMRCEPRRCCDAENSGESEAEQQVFHSARRPAQLRGTRLVAATRSTSVVDVVSEEVVAVSSIDVEVASTCAKAGLTMNSATASTITKTLPPANASVLPFILYGYCIL